MAECSRRCNVPQRFVTPHIPLPPLPPFQSALVQSALVLAALFMAALFPAALFLAGRQHCFGAGPHPSPQNSPL
eukprot:scaffold12513_cov68-Isochrysis_galbana.AAC.1